MKKTSSPQIIRPGQIRKRSPSPGDGLTSNFARQNHRKSSYFAFNYIKRAARKVAGIFVPAFVWKRKVDAHRKQVDFAKAHDLGGKLHFLRDHPAGHASRNSSRSRHSSGNAFGDVGSGQLTSFMLSFEEICKATGNFSPANKIGEGGFGTVYRGTLKDGLTIAIKRAKKDTYEQRLSVEFKNETRALSNIEHLNLVRFYGYLEQGGERIIVVEYVSNGTLRDHLDGIHGNQLEIAERLDIAIDVAHAITYLHTYTDPPIIHRDIKASNILVTDKLRAKVADFGFARLAAEDPTATHISTQIKGTAGYLDPEYLRTYQLTEKSDVYSFGVLLVEIITGRHPIESKRSLDERVTTRWAIKRLRDGEAVVAMDPRLRRNTPSIQAVEKVLELARQCLAPSRQSRPSMRKCAEVLWGIRKEFREDRVSLAAPTSFHSANVIERNTRITNKQHLFGIEDSDSLMFISA